MKNRKGSITAILTIGTLVVIGAAAILSAINVNKKQTTSSKAAAPVSCNTDTQERKSGNAATDTCTTQICGSYSNWAGSQSVSDDGKTRYCCCKKATTPAPPKPICQYTGTTASKDCRDDHTDNPGGCKLCSGGSYKYEASGGGASCSDPKPKKCLASNAIDFGCCPSDNTCDGKTCVPPPVDVSPDPLSSPLPWGKNQGGDGCGSGGVNYQYGSCYSGRRCVQCQHGGRWLSYNCFEDDSSCGGSDPVYCPPELPLKVCADGTHKCCNETKCIPSGNTGDATLPIANCTGTGSTQCGNNEYCGNAGGTCDGTDALASPAKICDSSVQKKCCVKAASKCSSGTRSCDGVPGSYSYYRNNEGSCSGTDPTGNCYSESNDGKCTSTTLKAIEEKNCKKPIASSCREHNTTCTVSGKKITYYQSTDTSCTSEASICYGTSGTNPTDCKEGSWAAISTKLCAETPDPSADKCSTPEGLDTNCNDLKSVCQGKTGITSKSYYVFGPNKFGIWDGKTCVSKDTKAMQEACGCPDVVLPATSCTFDGGIIVEPGKSKCQGNIIYKCDDKGTKTQENCGDKTQTCEATSQSPTCFSINLGKTSCIDNTSKKQKACGIPPDLLVEGSIDCVDTAGRAGKNTYSVFCGGQTSICSYYYKDRLNKDILLGYYLEEIPGYDCIVDPTHIDTAGASLTINNNAKVSGFFKSGAICLLVDNTNNGSNCQEITADELNSQTQFNKTFNIKITDSYKFIRGHAFDNTGKYYQDSQEINIGPNNTPRADGYGLTIDVNSPAVK